MAPGYAEVIYNPTAIYVASLTDAVAGTYGTPQLIEYGQKFEFDIESDNDEIMAYGLTVEALAVPKKATGTLTQAAMNFAAIAILCGFTNNSYLTTPNRYNIMDINVGGSGLPYFGVIVSYAATNGANMLAGFAKAQLDTVPGFKVDQNKFRIGEAKINGYAPNTQIRKVVRLKGNETAATVPTTGVTFGAFFSGMF